MGAFLGLLWSFWMDEAASDVYGVMNIGPTFGLNLAVFFAAIGERDNPTGRPSLRVTSGPDERGVLDPHPTDILRLDLIAGATQALSGLGVGRRDSFVADLEQLRAICAPGATTITIQGLLPTGPGVGVPIRTQLPIAPMQTAARQVGNYIATAKLAALAGKSIQELETWDDTDEEASRRIADGIHGNRSVVGAGDDAALLAGATLAAFGDPSGYDVVTARLDEALDSSFASDPYWGTAMRDPILLRTVVIAEEAGELAGYVSVG
jgi:hypothetical protein